MASSSSSNNCSIQPGAEDLCKRSGVPGDASLGLGQNFSHHSEASNINFGLELAERTHELQEIDDQIQIEINKTAQFCTSDQKVVVKGLFASLKTCANKVDLKADISGKIERSFSYFAAVKSNQINTNRQKAVRLTKKTLSVNYSQDGVKIDQFQWNQINASIERQQHEINDFWGNSSECIDVAGAVDVEIHTQLLAELKAVAKSGELLCGMEQEAIVAYFEQKYTEVKLAIKQTYDEQAQRISSLKTRFDKCINLKVRFQASKSSNDSTHTESHSNVKFGFNSNAISPSRSGLNAVDSILDGSMNVYNAK